MYGYVYETTNILNGRKYIGKHKSDSFDSSYKGSGKIIRLAFAKYGWENFSVRMLCPCFSLEELNTEEIFLIAYFNAVTDPNYYNIARGGDGRTCPATLEERLAMSIRRRGSGNVMYGKHHTDETKLKIRLKHLGMRLSESTKEKMSKSRKGRVGIQRFGSDNQFYGKKHTEATKDLIRSKLIGVKQSEETKIKRSKAQSGMIRITNGDHNTMISPDKLDYYVSIGYHRGVTRRS